MKKIIVLLTMILVLTGCGSKSIDVTFKMTNQK
ncbi:lipoprotein [Erysipelothrix rhusiopathiae]